AASPFARDRGFPVLRGHLGLAHVCLAHSSILTRGRARSAEARRAGPPAVVREASRRAPVRRAVEGPSSRAGAAQAERISRMRRAVSDGVLPTLTPAASRASFFAC